jgi:hypothetical protein
LFFPERLTHEFLDEAKRHMGTQFFANQYLNKVMDDESKPFKKGWMKYYDELPRNVYRFVFIDPAISQADSADFTAVVVVAVDALNNWYVEYANRHKITPTDIINLMFNITERFDPMQMGIEDVAFQKVLLYMAHEEMQRRNIIIPLTGVKPPTNKTKQIKILGLIPRFEWGRIYLNKGLYDFEQEYLDYSGERSRHDDLLDALSSIEAVITYPTTLKEEIKDVPPNHPDYEKYYRLKLQRGDRQRNQGY